LSGGQKQRIAIAGLIAMRPAALSSTNRRPCSIARAGEVIETIRRLNRRQGITVVLITHHMSETIEADRLIVMSEGEVFPDGRPKEVFRRSISSTGWA
jgi:energy-coupling factor transporter ATP-binding protein EcfA2